MKPEEWERVAPLASTEFLESTVALAQEGQRRFGPKHHLYSEWSAAIAACCRELAERDRRAAGVRL